MKRLVALIARLLLAALLCAGSSPALAHRFHAGIADIAYNDKTGNTEIVHTYMAHDIEALVATIAKRQVDLTQPEDEALLRSYIEQRFYIVGRDGARLPLKWVGMTVSVESIVIYQELAATPLDRLAQVHDAVLVDFLPRQANTVNLTRDGATVSLTFDEKTRERRIK